MIGGESGSLPEADEGSGWRAWCHGPTEHRWGKCGRVWKWEWVSERSELTVWLVPDRLPHHPGLDWHLRSSRWPSGHSKQGCRITSTLFVNTKLLDFLLVWLLFLNLVSLFKVRGIFHTRYNIPVTVKGIGKGPGLHQLLTTQPPCGCIVKSPETQL